MTSNSANRPPNEATPRGVYNPITLGEQNDEELPQLTKLLAALLFTVIFMVSWKRPELAPLTILVLAGCLLYRLDARQRKLASAPLILAAIRLCLMLSERIVTTGGFALDHLVLKRPAPMFGPVMTGDWGITWIPAFLSACLFYLPRKDSITLKIVAVEAIAVILSSLLPGDGFASVLAVFNATLFFAVTIGLLFDLKPGLREWFRPPEHRTAPIRVQIATPPPPRPVG